MAYLHLLLAFAVFTLLDVLVTVFGLRVGCVELNPVVTEWGIESWAIFRIILLVFMFTIFLAGYRFFLKYYKRLSFFLKTTVIILNLFMVIVVSSGILAVIYVAF